VRAVGHDSPRERRADVQARLLGDHAGIDDMRILSSLSTWSAGARPRALPAAPRWRCVLC
jgi:hypothetical protein